MSDKKLQVIPLGGLGEFGMHMMALRYGDDIVVIDAGMMFPEAELLGVDIVTPDLTFLKEHREHVRALLLTHGHEDHIGAVAFFLAEFNVPVYGTAFTLSLVERRLEEYDVEEDPTLRAVKPKDIIEIGPFKVEFIHVTHSIVSCVALAITTPLGVVIHTGDFKVDPTPTDNELFDLHTLADYGKRGVLLLLSDSTNADRPGYSDSERAVRPRLEDVFNRSESRLVRFLLQLFDSPAAADHRPLGGVRPQGRAGGPQHDRGDRNRAQPRLPADSGQHSDSPAGCDGREAVEGDGADFGHAGRADVGAVARGGG